MAPLFSYDDSRDPGMILVTNAIANETNQSHGTNCVKEALEKYKYRFEGIGKLKVIQVDLNLDPNFTPVAQPSAPPTIQHT